MKKKEDSREIRKLKKRTRGYSIKEGILWSGESAFGANYVSPFAVAINSSNSLIAMLSSITGLVGPFAQIFGSRLIEKYPRKKIIQKTVFLETLTWIPFILIAISFSRGVLLQVLPFLLLFSFSLYTLLASLGHPAWFSWMGDIVDEKKRGRWFSKRNFLMGAISVVLVISSSFFLDYLKRKNMPMTGFAILFSLALISRFFSWRTFKNQYEPKIKLKKGDYFSFSDFLLNAKNNNFGRFTLFRFFFTFAASVSSPLLVIYLLRTLNFSYSEYMIIIFTGTGISLFTFELWGKFSDKYGNYRALSVASWLIAFVPFLWILHPSIIYLVLVPSVVSAVSWAGLHLTELNFIYENVRPEKRGLALSYYNMLWGLGIFFGAGLSAFLIKFLTIDFIKPIIFIFILGTFARFIVLLWWLPRIKEVRKTGNFKGGKVFKEIVLKQAVPTIYGEVNDLVHLKKYFAMK